MKIKTHGHSGIESQLTTDFKCAGKIRHIGRLDVEAQRITHSTLVEEPYQIADGEILNIYVSFTIERVLFVPQLERDLLIPVTLDDFANTLNAYAEWKAKHPGKKSNAGIEEVIWHDPMLEVSFD